MPQVQQKIGNDYKTVQIPFTMTLAIDELVMLSAANEGTDFRILEPVSELAELHLDAPVRYNAHAETFFVLCSCGAVFLGDSNDDASSSQLEHVENVMPASDDEEYEALPAVRQRSARRAAQDVGVTFPEKEPGDLESSVIVAMVDMLHLLEFVAHGSENSADKILAETLDIFITEKESK